MSRVYISKNTEYDINEVYPSIVKHFESFGIANKLNNNTRVVIKPNLLMKRKPNEFTTTHPVIVEAVVKYLQYIGVRRITIADSPGGPYTKSSLTGIYHASGMERVATEYNVELNFDLTSKVKRNDENKLVKEFDIITPICEADFIIDIAKLKSHAMTGLSGGVKNLFGCIPGLTKPEFHFRFPQKDLFSQMLVDLSKTVKPDFVIVDAIESMEGDGPSGGDLRKTDLLLSSTNIYDLDFVLCQLIGVNPEDILTVKAAMESGFCADNLDKIEIVGMTIPQIEKFKMPHDKTIDFSSHAPKFLQKPLNLFSKKFLTSRPKIRYNECIGCGKCAESCPPKVISIVNKKAIIDNKNCISCFCCHEMCPVKVIDIKRPKILKW